MTVLVFMAASPEKLLVWKLASAAWDVTKQDVTEKMAFFFKERN